MLLDPVHAFPCRDVEFCEATAVFDELRRLFPAINRRWNETDTIDKLIKPILVRCLGYDEADLHSTVDPSLHYGNTLLLPDLHLRSDQSIEVVIETKKIKVNLYAQGNSGDSNFNDGLDQTLTYLDNTEARAAILTNGNNWFLCRRGPTRHPSGLGFSEYSCIHFRLDYPLAMDGVEQIRAFVSLFHRLSATGMANGTTTFGSSDDQRWWRKQYQVHCTVRFHHLIDAPLRGPRSGFKQPFSPLKAKVKRLQ